MYDAIVLAGGAARRLGGWDKAGLEVGDATLLARVVAAVSGAARVAVVGPRRDVPRPVTWCRESPPGGGPVAALAAGLHHSSAEVVVVLAADLPFVAPAVPVLVSALRDPAVAAALLTDHDGRVNYLAGAWSRPALSAALDALGPPAGASMRTLAAALTGAVRSVPDPQGWGRDCDTWADVTAARSAAARATAR